jgi:hypothetical protein
VPTRSCGRVVSGRERSIRKFVRWAPTICPSTSPWERDRRPNGGGGRLRVAALIWVGTLYLRLHSLPARKAHKSENLQCEIVATLGLPALWDHRSTLYDDAEMPNKQRITWNGIALHGAIAVGDFISEGIPH